MKLIQMCLRKLKIYSPLHGMGAVWLKKKKVMRLEKIYLCQVQQVSLKVFVKHLNENSLY